jgi:hypothetical protein
MGLVPGLDINRWFLGYVCHTAEPHFCGFSTFCEIRYLGCARITISYRCKWCSDRWSFTYHSPICDPIILRWVNVKSHHHSSGLKRNWLNSDRITIWRMGGQRASKTALFMYIWNADMLTTQIVNWSQRSEYAKRWNRQKICGFGAVQWFDVLKPIAMVPAMFQSAPRTIPLIWNRF